MPQTPNIHSYLPELAGADRVLVALSGGVDSTLLLSLVVEAIGSERVLALHCNHNIHPQSGQWQLACEAYCEKLGVEIRTRSLILEPKGEGLEAGARRARYLFFADICRVGDLLLTAHHRDDQAETLMLRLMRGAGLRGLCGMPRRRPLGKAVLLRPLLDFSRSSILELARERSLCWIEDPSNQGLEQDRNFLRNEIMPGLSLRWPEASALLARAADNLGHAMALQVEYIDRLFVELDWRSEVIGASFSQSAWIDLSDSARRAVIDHSLQRLGLAGFQSGLSERLLDEVAAASADAKPLLASGNSEFRRYRDRIYVMPKLADVKDYQLPWNGCEILVIPGVGNLLSGSQQSDYIVRNRRPGDRCKPLDRQHSQSLKKLLQEAGLPP